MRRDGAACYQYPQSGSGLNNTAPPAYYPSSFQTIGSAPQYATPQGESWSGRIVEFESKMGEDDLEQPRNFWERILAKEPGQQENLVNNVAEHLAEAAPRIREKAYGKAMMMAPHVSRSYVPTLFFPSSSEKSRSRC